MLPTRVSFFLSTVDRIPQLNVSIFSKFSQILLQFWITMTVVNIFMFYHGGPSLFSVTVTKIPISRVIKINHFLLFSPIVNRNQHSESWQYFKYSDCFQFNNCNKRKENKLYSRQENNYFSPFSDTK